MTRFFIGLLFAAVALAMQAGVAREKPPDKICGAVGVGTNDVKEILLNLGPNMALYDGAVNAIPSCTHAP